MKYKEEFVTRDVIIKFKKLFNICMTREQNLRNKRMLSKKYIS